MALSVAVIGAGAAGLAAARELLREGHSVTVYEQGSDVGGVWVYTEEKETDPLGQSTGRRQVHSSMYADLRTNLPREIMGFPSFPFTTDFPGSHDARQFPSHTEVRSYLAAYASAFDLLPHIRFGTRVLRVEEEGKNGATQWVVTTAPVNGTGAENAVVSRHDAVVVCNGHYSQPRVPNIPGAAEFPGKLFHSHNYRLATDHIGQRVVLLGAAASGVDIADELVGVASRVYLSARNFRNPLTDEVIEMEVHGSSNGEEEGAGASQHVAHVAGIARLLPNGSVELADGCVLPNIDVVMFCTGYDYSFPFLDSKIVNVEEGRVGPLYLHTMPPRFAPRLAFIGLCFKTVPMPQAEVQALWIARSLAGRAVELPSVQEMEEAVDAFYADLAAEGVEQRNTHRCQGRGQWILNADFARLARGPEVGVWREELYAATGLQRGEHPHSYRDIQVVGGTRWAAAAAAETAAVLAWEEEQMKLPVPVA